MNIKKSVILLYICFMGLLAILSNGRCYAQQNSIHNILAFTRINQVVVSPNGAGVAFITGQRNQANPSQWQYVLNLKNKNDAAKEITRADYIGSLAWSPDGKDLAYFVVNHQQKTLAIYHVPTQQIMPVINLNGFINALKWSHSGKQIAFVADLTHVKNDENGLLNVANEGSNTQLYLMSNIQPNAVFHPITPTNISISDSVFGGGFDWASDDSKIAFTYQPSSKSIDGLKTKVAVLQLNTLQYAPLDYCQHRACAQPYYSPDQHWLAFATNLPANGAAKTLLEDIEIRNQICVMDSVNRVHCLPTTFNGNPYILGWKADSKALYVADMYKSDGPKIYELSINTGVPIKLMSTQNDFMEPLTLSLNNTHTVFGFSAESTNKAPEVFTASTDEFQPQQITELNSKFDTPIGQTQVLHWHSKDGLPIEGLLITPTDYNPHKKYPLYVDVHGGPASAQFKRYLGGCDEYALMFPPTTCPANFLNLGYVILQINYRGSNGYGVDFRLKNYADFGGGDFQDIMTGIDYLQQQGVINPNKIVIAGWSAGGYMTAWAITQTKCFSAAIDGDGITDFISYTGTSDDHDFFYRYLGSYFWDSNYQLHWQRSPIAHVKNITTPLLILQGEQDNRVPISQAQELYTALDIMHKPIKMLIAPNQAHVPTDPDTVEKELLAINQWLTNN
jgi:dipeptidyl aminopeptidase/acylaminoacyl peptidase